jgi:hypothetical protein
MRSKKRVNSMGDNDNACKKSTMYHSYTSHKSYPMNILINSCNIKNIMHVLYSFIHSFIDSQELILLLYCTSNQVHARYCTGTTGVEFSRARPESGVRSPESEFIPNTGVRQSRSVRRFEFEYSDLRLASATCEIGLTKTSVLYCSAHYYYCNCSCSCN